MKQFEIRRIPGSASRSGQNFSCDVRLSSNIQPMCAKARPLLSAFQSLPNRHGECGSPSRSVTCESHHPRRYVCRETAPVTLRRQ